MITKINDLFRRKLSAVRVFSLLFPLSSFLLLSSCGNKPSEEEMAKAEQLIEAAHKAKDFQRLNLLADSLEADGSLSQAKAYYWRGYASDRTKHLRMAEFYYNIALKAATDDPEIYAKAASHQLNLMALRGDYENGLKLATPVVRQLEEQKCDSTSDYVNLLIYIGCCQAGLGNSGEATSDGFDKAYRKHLENVSKNRTDEAYKDAIAGLINIVYSCNHTGNFHDAMKWNGHLSEMLNEYEQRPGVNSDYVDKQQARYNLYQAQALEGIGKADEAAKIFDAYRTTQFAKTPEGRILANNYLISANRWEEAAENYQSLDAILGDGPDGYSLQNIEEMVLKKYQANLMAGRRDSAIAVSMLLCDSLVTAFQRAKEEDAKEQAVIVSKVEEMNNQQNKAARQQQYGILALIAFLFLAIIGYVFYRRYHHHQLHKAHKELRKEFNELEEVTSERTRVDTERGIAASIQQYIAHEPLSQHDNLTLLVSQIPGTMPGGSFYETILAGDSLLFCIGSATGKGVVAATAAAMAWAQFRSVAAFEHMPERIVTAISEAIADRKYMPVKLFVGSLNIKTGDFQYCNAGNCTPLLTDKDISILPDNGNKPAGLEPGIVYTAQETNIAPDKLLFLFTEGIVEAVDANGRKLGEKHLRGMSLQAVKLNAKAQPFYDNIIQAICGFTGNIPQADDLTFMIIGRKNSQKTT